MRTAQVALLVLVAFVAVSSALQREARAQATLSAQDDPSAAVSTSTAPDPTTSIVPTPSVDPDVLAETRLKEFEAKGVTRERVLNTYTMKELGVPTLNSDKARTGAAISSQSLTPIKGDVRAFDKVFAYQLPFMTADEKKALLAITINGKLLEGQKIFYEILVRSYLNTPVNTGATKPLDPSTPPPSPIGPGTISP